MKCFNPDCLYENLPTNNFCIKCGNKLLLMGRYGGLNYLGEGHFFRAFSAVDRSRNNSKCFIKQILPDPCHKNDALQRCILFVEQKAQILEKLGKHPQIPDFLAFFEQNGRVYLIQEFVEGEDLLTELQRKGRFTEHEVKTFLLNMLPVLDFIHNNNVVHYNIKPENILRRKTPLDPSIYGENRDLVLIGGFGISHNDYDVSRFRNESIGNPGYTPPERNFHLYNEAKNTDLYSLAVIVVRLLTGIVPKIIKEAHSNSMIDDLYCDYHYHGSKIRWDWKDYLQELNIFISRDLEQVLDRMLQEFPGDRYQNAKDALAQLQSPTITSKTRANYIKLERLLADQKWEDANQETGKIMLKIMNKQKQGWLDYDDHQNFPKEELKIIDNLWVKYSNGYFGFSVQKEILTSIKVNNSDDSCDISDKFITEVWGKKALKNWCYASNIFPAILSSDIKINKGYYPWVILEWVWKQLGFASEFGDITIIYCNFIDIIEPLFSSLESS